MFKAYLETEHFIFEAYGASEEEARAALLAGWEVHRVQYRATAGFPDYADDVQVSEIRLGAAYRDREEIRS